MPRECPLCGLVCSDTALGCESGRGRCKLPGPQGALPMKPALGLSLLCLLLAASPQAWAGPPQAPAPGQARVAPPAVAEDGLLELRMENRRWTEVFRWLSEATGVPFV